jgi:hypothetical protein
MKELLDGSNTKYCEIKKLRIKQASWPWMLSCLGLHVIRMMVLLVTFRNLRLLPPSLTAYFAIIG